MSLGEDYDGSWPQLANTTLVQVFSDYLPDFCRRGPLRELASRELLSITRAQLGAELPFSLLVEHCVGRLPQPPPVPRLSALGIDL